MLRSNLSSSSFNDLFPRYAQTSIESETCEGLSMTKVAKRFRLSLASVMRWSKTLEPITKRKKPATKIDMEALKRDVEKYPDAYS